MSSDQRSAASFSIQVLKHFDDSLCVLGVKVSSARALGKEVRDVYAYASATR